MRRKRERVNSPLIETPVPPPQDEQEIPPLAPNSKAC